MCPHVYQHLYMTWPGGFSFGLYAHLAYMLSMIMDRIHHHKVCWAWWPTIGGGNCDKQSLGSGASRWQKHFVIYVQQVAIAEAGLATFAEGITAIVTAWTSSQ